MSIRTMQEFMMLAAQRGLTTDDQHTFIVVNPFASMETFMLRRTLVKKYAWVLPWQGYLGKRGDSKGLYFASTQEIKKAYNNLFVLHPVSIRLAYLVFLLNDINQE